MLDEVGPDAARLTYLLQSVDSTQTFDFDLVTSQANDNPVFYVQMAYARIQSIFRVAAERGRRAGPAGRGRPRRCSPTSASSTCCGRSPSSPTPSSPRPPTGRRTASPRGCASSPAAVHGFYHDCYVMGEGVSPELTQARLWLVEAASVGLAIGLDLLGVSAPDQM